MLKDVAIYISDCGGKLLRRFMSKAPYQNGKDGENKKMLYVSKIIQEGLEKN